MKHIIVLALFLITSLLNAQGVQEVKKIPVTETITPPAQGQQAVPTQTTIPSFKEIWVYLMTGDEAAFSPKYPITDLAFFGASLDSYGELTDVPDPKAIKGYTGRKHLVIALVDSYSLTHMALFPGFPVREKFLDDLVKASAPYDGVQLDFETIPTKDMDYFKSMLIELKSRLKDKCISVAVMARTSSYDENYDYKFLNGVVDRIIIMAYDEHWSDSEPGPVSSLNWSRDVARYAKTLISPEKLVMGAPFYGRSWADKRLAHSYKYSTIKKIMKAENITQPVRINGIPSFDYETSVKVKVFYDDIDSSLVRLNQYNTEGVSNVAFWCLGNENPDIWNYLQTQK